jgi:SAM-dependent methyltransferase
MFKRVVGQAHGKLVFQRRIHALATVIAPLLSRGKILDLGAGNGQIGALLMTLRSDIEVTGIDVHLRPETFIPVIEYDGQHIPFEDDTFAGVIVVDVLHHTDDFRAILRECLRVSPRVVIKDHFYENAVEHLILRGLDWVGNAPHGVRLPYNYFTRRQWEDALQTLGARETHRQEHLPGMYPLPFQYVIGQRIQFVARIERHSHS